MSGSGRGDWGSIPQDTVSALHGSFHEKRAVRRASEPRERDRKHAEGDTPPNVLTFLKKRTEHIRKRLGSALERVAKHVADALNQSEEMAKTKEAIRKTAHSALWNRIMKNPNTGGEWMRYAQEPRQNRDNHIEKREGDAR